MNHSVSAGTMMQSADNLCWIVCGELRAAHHDFGAALGESRCMMGVHQTLPVAGGVHDSFEPMTIQPRNRANPSQACWRHTGLPGRSTNSAPSAATVINVAPM